MGTYALLIIGVLIGGFIVGIFMYLKDTCEDDYDELLTYNKNLRDELYLSDKLAKDIKLELDSTNSKLHYQKSKSSGYRKTIKDLKDDLLKEEKDIKKYKEKIDILLTKITKGHKLPKDISKNKKSVIDLIDIIFNEKKSKLKVLGFSVKELNEYKDIWLENLIYDLKQSK